MMHSVIRGLAAAALSKVDKDKAAKAAVVVATALGSGEGHPTLKRAASLAAQTLQSRGGQTPAPLTEPAYEVAPNEATTVHNLPEGKRDKDKAIKGAAALATAVANGQGHPSLRRAANVLVDMLQAPATQAPAAQVPVSPDTTAQWQQVAEAMCRLQSGGSDEGADLNATPPQCPRGVMQSPFAVPAVAVLRGTMDTANCGDFSFTLYTAQLIVSMLGTGGGIGGEYHVPSLPLHVWTRLIGRDSSPLPVIVFRDHGAITVQVGNVPMHAGPTASPTR